MKNKKILLSLIIILLLLFSYHEINSNFRLGNILRDIIFTPFRKDYSNNLYTLINNEIKTENEELKKLVDIDYSLTDFDVINSSVIERNNTYWLDELVINKGKRDGVITNQIVISKDGMIGKVLSTSNKTSIIKLITGFNNPFMVSINDLGKVLEIDNYNLYIKGINKKDNIKEGDKVVTNGLMDDFPSGILIGEIEKIEIDKDNTGLYAKVKLTSDINNVRFVSVLVRKNK